MAAYSQEMRDRVLRAIERGERPLHIARRLEVSRMWVWRVRHRFECEGIRTSLPQGGQRRSRLAPVEQMIRDWISAQPDLTLAEIQARLARHKIRIQIPALWHQLNKWGLTYKKNSSRRRAVAS